jgi:hypothetical protein
MAKKSEAKPAQTELAVATKSLLPAIIQPTQDADAVFNASDNMAGVDAVIPVIEITHAAQVFKFGEGEVVKTFRGIILHHSAGRGYWKDPEVRGTPPDCSSSNGIFPDMGTAPFKPGPSGKPACCNCPMNDWGTDPKGGRGKACKQKHSLFVLVLDEAYQSAIPYLLRAPATSLKAIGAYMTALTGKRTPVQTVVTKFSLASAEGQGQTYSQLVLSAEREKLNRDDQLMLKAMIDQFGSKFKKVAAEEVAKQEDEAPAGPDPDNFA